LEKLSRALRQFTGKEGAEAAVALLIRVVGESLEVLVVERVVSARDPWSGQIALPGGKRGAEDADLRATAVREVLEETGIDILKKGQFLGVLSVSASSGRADMRVLPFVILVEDEPTVNLNTAELEWFAWIPMNDLIRHRGRVEFAFGEQPAYAIDDVVIWGLTFRILEEFFAVFTNSKRSRAK
jgi:8-oxo-dGTP pyrophosphatase MutT (NUDIX family)